MKMSWLLLRQSLEIRPTFITCFPTFDPWIDRVGLVRNHPKTSLLWTCLSFALDATSNERPKFGPEMFLHMTQLVASFIPSLFPKKPSLAFGNLVMHDGKTSTSHKSKGYFGQKLNNPESLLGISTSMFMPQKNQNIRYPVIPKIFQHLSSIQKFRVSGVSVSRWHPAQRTRSFLGSRLRRSQHWDDVGKSMVFFGCENGDLFYGIIWVL